MVSDDLPAALPTSSPKTREIEPKVHRPPRNAIGYPWQDNGGKANCANDTKSSGNHREPLGTREEASSRVDLASINSQWPHRAVERPEATQRDV